MPSFLSLISISKSDMPYMLLQMLYKNWKLLIRKLREVDLNFHVAFLQDIDRHILLRTSLIFINSTTFHAATLRIPLHDNTCLWIVCDNVYTNLKLQVFSQTFSLKPWKKNSTFLPATRKAWDVGEVPILSTEFWYIWHGVSDNFPRTITKISIIYFHFLMNYSCTASHVKHTHTHTPNFSYR